MNKLAFLILLYLTCLIYDAHSQCTGNLLTNGSFTSVEGENVTAPGWTGFSTPDINDENGTVYTSTGYSWTGIPLASPDGGTWQNLFGIESVEQIVNVTPGQGYTVCFEYAAQGIYNSSFQFAGPVGVNVFINGVLSYTTPDDSTQYTWETSCYSFIAGTTGLTIKLVPSQTQFVGIDGACLTPVVNPSVNENPGSHLDFGISPNPFTANLNVTVSNAENTEIILYNITSGIMMHEQFKNTISLNTEHLAKGIYFYELRDNSGVIKKGRIVKG